MLRSHPTGTSAVVSLETDPPVHLKSHASVQNAAEAWHRARADIEGRTRASTHNSGPYR